MNALKASFPAAPLALAHPFRLSPRPSQHPVLRPSAYVHSIVHHLMLALAAGTPVKGKEAAGGPGWDLMGSLLGRLSRRGFAMQVRLITRRP